MSSIRVPHEGPETHTVDSSCESPAGVTPPSVSHFLAIYSVRKRLRECIIGWACNLPDCHLCGKRIARRARADMLAKFENHPECISLRFSVELTRDLDQGYEDLSRARTQFMKLACLSRTSLGYLRSTEVTRVHARWNWHDHVVVIPRENARAEARRLLDLWDDACRQIGLEPSSHARGESETPDAIKYVLKRRLGRGGGSLRDLLERAARGDADAAEDYLAWDAWRQRNPHARFRHSWIASGSQRQSEPRDQTQTEVPDSDLAQMALLDSLGAGTNAQQMFMLGLSRRSIQRRRSYFPPARPGLIPYRVTHAD